MSLSYEFSVSHGAPFQLYITRVAEARRRVILRQLESAGLHDARPSSKSKSERDSGICPAH